MTRTVLWTLNAWALSLRGMKVRFPAYIGPTLIVAGIRQIAVGRNVVIWPGLRIEAHGDASITIEDGCVIGPNCHITCAGGLIIGAGTILEGMNVVTDISHTTTELEKAVNKRPWTIQPTRLGRGVFCGVGSLILPGSDIADGSVIEPNAVVTTKSEVRSLISGVPASFRAIPSV